MNDNKNVTIYRDIYHMNEPFYITVNEALERIRDGKSSEKVAIIRATLDKDKADNMKKQLPAICFSGKFSKGRQDSGIVKHSGFIVLDFDSVDMDNYESIMSDVMSLDYVYAAWISPRGNGMKVLVRIANGKKHRQHFEALKDIFPNVDNSGINESRVCFESYDPNIYINTNAVPFTTVKVVEYVENRSVVKEEYEVFRRLLSWLTNRRDSFVKGERNLFVFKLASACCRFGLPEDSAVDLIMQEYPTSSDFTSKECSQTIRSAYKANRSKSGTAKFENEKLVEVETKMEIEIDTTYYDTSVRPKDVIYSDAVKDNAINIYRRGYEAVKGIGVEDIDKLFKFKRGEYTLASGIPNYGKSYLMAKWMLLMRVLLYGEKFAIFSPEENPAEEFYHDFVEILLGADCTPANAHGRPSLEEYSNAYDWVGRHIFYIYPESATPTPEYVLGRFLELIIKEKVDGVILDPFNQLSHNYASAGGRTDLYLEATLSIFKRFAVENNVYEIIIGHPNKMSKDSSGEYPCPDIYDMSNGAMWSNKIDNLVIIHRPFGVTKPDDPTCEFHSKKIKKQKQVGIRGSSTFYLNRAIRRYMFSKEKDPMSTIIQKKKISFKNQQATLL